MNAINDTTTLKAGDRVAVAFSHRANVRYQGAIVARVTPTGIVTITTGEQFSRNGRRRPFGSGVLQWLCYNPAPQNESKE